MAKAIASGDSRLMQKAGLEGEIARLERQRAAHIDDQHDIRRQIHDARARSRRAEAPDRRRSATTSRAAMPTRGDAFAMEMDGRTHRPNARSPAARC